MMDRQLANLSSLTNDAMEQQDIESSNQTFEYVPVFQVVCSYAYFACLTLETFLSF